MIAQRQMQAGGFWATIIERNVISIIISIAHCCIGFLQAISLIAYQAYSLFMSTHSFCANNANVTQPIGFSRLVSEGVGICWADGRSSGVALNP